MIIAELHCQFIYIFDQSLLLFLSSLWIVTWHRRYWKIKITALSATCGRWVWSCIICKTFLPRPTFASDDHFCSICGRHPFVANDERRVLELIRSQKLRYDSEKFRHLSSTGVLLCRWFLSLRGERFYLSFRFGILAGNARLRHCPSSNDGRVDCTSVVNCKLAVPFSMQKSFLFGITGWCRSRTNQRYHHHDERISSRKWSTTTDLSWTISSGVGHQYTHDTSTTSVRFYIQRFIRFENVQTRQDPWESPWTSVESSTNEKAIDHCV